ncbi:MAG: flippase-like domain-containing protein [Chitinophagaceae bacterium]|nr:MAG: flippase-like domain-containing protein [Chitinophagaceae bacterium]
MKKKLQSLVQYIFFLGFGVFLVWWSLRKIDANDWTDIKKSFENANYWLVVPVIITLLLSHLSRAMRWKILMEPLGYKPKLSNTYMAVLIGYMANLALPRLGEVLKCTILARYEKVPADKLIGTIVAERAFDVICLLIIIAITVVVQVDLIGEYISNLLGSIVKSKTSSFSTGKLFLVLGILLVLIAATWFIFKKLSHLGFIKKIKVIMTGIWSGVISVRYLKNKKWFIFHSIFIWVMFLVSVQIGLWALKETSGYGIKEALSVLSTGSIAMIIPTPGGIGVYPIFVQQTLLLYGLKESIGFAFGSLMWGVQFFQMLMSGFVALLLLPYLNKKSRNEKS